MKRKEEQGKKSHKHHKTTKKKFVHLESFVGIQSGIKYKLAIPLPR